MLYVENVQVQFTTVRKNAVLVRAQRIQVELSASAPLEAYF